MKKDLTRWKPEMPDHLFHSANYKELLQKVVPLRKAYRKERDSQARKVIAKEEFDLWFNYV